MRQVAYFCYHRKDDNVLETSIKSLRSVSKCEIVIATDDTPLPLQRQLADKYGVQWDVVAPEQMITRRATCKVERLQALIELAPDDTCVIAVDVDTYFVQDPFIPFTERPAMDLGLTSRGYLYWSTINGGVFFLRVNPRSRIWLSWHVGEIFHPRWRPYVDVRQTFDHERLGLDWTVNQDFLIACWEHREEVESLLGTHIEDVGPAYNFCPPTDLDRADAEQKVRQAYQEQSVSILHLKSALKDLIYEDLLEHAVTHHARGGACWL